MPKVIQDFRKDGKWVRTVRISGEQFVTKSGLIFNHMKARCAKGMKYQSIQPTYRTCEIGPSFRVFENFAQWYTSQEGSNLPEYHLDKDILDYGNKVYCKEKCLVVPRELNMFLTFKTISRDMPVGVCYFPHRGTKYVAQINISNKLQNLGYFNSAEEAFDVYVNAKENEAFRWYKRLSSGEFVVSPKVVEVMKNWKFPKSLLMDNYERK